MNETENKEEKLELVFGTENLLESAKEPFIGEVIYAEFPCNCEECKKGAATMLEKFQKEAPERLHIHIKPRDVLLYIPWKEHSVYRDISYNISWSLCLAQRDF